MDEFVHRLSPEVLEHLATLVGARWDCVGTSHLMLGDVLACPAILATDSAVVALSIEDNEEFLADDYEVVTKVIEVPLGDSFASAKRNGTLRVHGKGEIVSSVQVIREELTKVIDGEALFTISADTGVVVVLESLVVAVQKRGIRGFDFLSTRASTVDGLDLHDPSRDWPLNLVESFASSRELISIVSK